MNEIPIVVTYNIRSAVRLRTPPHTLSLSSMAIWADG
jgi:hypothetical protein